MKIPLTEKYRPQSFGDLVLPTNHGLGAAVQFLANPHRSRWMLTGKSGLGKSSLAEIMAKACADPNCVTTIPGPDLGCDTVRDLVSASLTRPLYGNWYAYVCHEADAIPRVAQVRLLSALEEPSYAIWIFTSNESAENWEGRFLSRFTHLEFSNQRLAEPAMEWISRIAALEGMILNHDEAEKIIRGAKNNLRAALQKLEAILGNQQALLLSKMSGLAAQVADRGAAQKESPGGSKPAPTPSPLPLIDSLDEPRKLILSVEKLKSS